MVEVRAQPGVEPGTSHTRNANHTPRALSLDLLLQVDVKSTIRLLKQRKGKFIISGGLYLSDVEAASTLHAYLLSDVEELTRRVESHLARRDQPCLATQQPLICEVRFGFRRCRRGIKGQPYFISNAHVVCHDAPDACDVCVDWQGMFAQALDMQCKPKLSQKRATTHSYN